ncbi:MAG: sigma-70 family RNA polymerase sigma factor [Treponema sp.]|nr:sigma-70 family RNA polymerase sigma factor [Treponema sp.]
MQKKEPKSSDNLLEIYFRQIKAFPLLTFDEEIELSKKIQASDNEAVSKTALNKLVNSNLRLVMKIAGLFNVPEVPVMDIIQEGNIGLIHAAKKFDYRKNARFCTYASWWIRQFMSRYITSKRRIVRLPERKEETVRKIQRAYHVLSQNLMHQPSSADIAKELGIPVKEVDSYFFMAADSINLEQNNDDITSVMDIHEDYTYNPELDLMKRESHNSTARILNKLPENERRIINYRYQLNGCIRHTLREIGEKFDISPETVRQIERRALRRIRTHANELRDSVYVEAM